MKDAAELKQNLRQFTGTDQWFRHWANRNMLYTNGVEYFAEHAGGGAHWFLDIVATEIMPHAKTQPFMSVKLKVERPDSVAMGSAVITADDGNGNVLHTRKIDLTDAPDGEWAFFLTNDVLLLPSEY